MDTEIVFEKGEIKPTFNDLGVGDWFVLSGGLYRKLNRNSAVRASDGATVITGFFNGFGAESLVTKAKVKIIVC